MGNVRILLADEMGTGKAQPVNTPVLTPSGWVPIGEIVPGDYVIGANGAPTMVTGVFPQGKKPVYRVTFTDGASTRCCGEHLWAVQTPNDRFRNPEKFRVMELRRFMSDLKTYAGNSKWFIPMTAPVSFTTGPDLPVDPYLLGVLLGDGGLTHRVTFTNIDEGVVNAVRDSIPNSVSITQKTTMQYSIVGPGPAKQNTVMDALRSLDVMGKMAHEKRIPKEYLMASPEQRLKVLQGLVDTDGHVYQGCGVEFTSTSIGLIQDVQFIVGSLGGTTTAHPLGRNNTYTHNESKREGRLSYRIHIVLPGDICPVGYSSDKLSKWTPRTKYFPRRAFETVVLDGEEECVCISVEAEDRLYVTEDFIVTHNTLQTLSVIQACGFKKSLIVCPANAKGNWPEEARKFFPGKTVSMVSTKTPDFSADIVIINYDILAKFQDVIIDTGFDFIALDESHYIANKTTARSRAAINIGATIPNRMCLSGTPMRNGPIDLVQQLVFLDKLTAMGGFWPFVTRYCDATKTVFGWDLTGSSNLDEMNLKMREAGFYIRREKKEVIPELPDLTEETVNLALSNLREYRAADKDLRAYMSGKARASGVDLDDPTARAEFTKSLSGDAEHLQRISALRQLAAQGKMAAVKAWVDDFMATGKKLVIFAHHRPIVEAIAAFYPEQTVSIMGGDSPEHRVSATKSFQEDPSIRIFVGNIKAAGIAITLTAASHVAFVELPWTFADLAQAYDRCNRMGQKNAVNVYYLMAEGTIDDMMMSVVRSKQNDMEQGTMNAVIDAMLSV